MGHSDPITLIEKLMIATAFLIVVLLVAGCTTTGTALVAAPPLVNYSKTTQAQGSAELKAISDKYPIVRRYISDYGKLRDAIRLLRKKRKQ